MILEYKSFGVKADGLSQDGRTISGYASVKHEIDSYYDVIENGAYAELNELLTRGWFCNHHDWRADPIGMITECREDEKGLFFTAKFHDTVAAQDAYRIAKERLEQGKVVSFSIGYFVEESRTDVIDGVEVRRLVKILVKEISLVTIPAAINATATMIKSGRRFEDHIKAVIEDADDLLSRFKAFDNDRKQGLTDRKKEQLKEVKGALEQVLSSFGELLQDKDESKIILVDVENTGVPL